MPFPSPRPSANAAAARPGPAAGPARVWLGVALLIPAQVPLPAQQAPLAPARAAGQTVTPAFEGWYRNPDGTYSLSFGYFNRNTEEVVELPVGPHNRMEPGEADRGQPTHFQPRRHWGVFAVRVPADFGHQTIRWTLVVRGDTLSVPGSLKRGWEIDALAGEAGSGNTPPVLRLEPGGATGRGPAGVTAGPLAARVGEPLALTVWAADDGRAATSIVTAGREGVPVTLTWVKHRGPGAVRFAPASPSVDPMDGKATTTATFDAAGSYLLRVRANDASGVTGAGHAQCCWTNGFVRVTVAPRASSPLGLLPPASFSLDTITYSRHVAPILQQKCQVCHRPGSIAPMSLRTYDEVRPFAALIKQRVQARIMPPWHIDRSVGIREFKNDRSLSDAQLEAIVRWVDAGAPEGDPADLPPPVVWPDPAAWQLAESFGQPDLVIRSRPYTVRPEGQDKWWRPSVETGLTEPRWVRAIEVKPSFPLGRKSVHHVLTLLEQEEDGITGLASTARESGQRMSAGLFMEWAVGKVGEVFPEGAGKLMLPGSRIRWEVHYYAVGETIPDDVVEMGVWFYPRHTVPRNRTILRMFNAAPGSELDIPPRRQSITQNFYTLPAPARLENFQPHMHMRGKAMSMEAVYPDGRRELLSMVSHFQWRWHVNYIFADQAAPLLPRGTVLVLTAWHDNTPGNPANPDPDQWVGWGDRTVDEMAHAWVDVTYLEQGEFDRLVAERKARTEKKETP